MINVNDIVAVGGILVGVIGAIFGLVPYLKKRKINTEEILGTAGNVLEATEPIIQVAKGIPALKPAATLVDWIEQKAVAGVKAAEQLAHAGSLTSNEEKFKSAQQTVYDALKEIGITPTDNQKKLIDDFIQEAVNDLGHSIPTEAEKNAQIAKTQQDLAAVQNENTQLKQTIASIQSTVGTATAQ
ncbi:MAG: phage holin, LLH family [Clostridium sp.]|jgi:hypothetical protein|uniref:phage holin, LLH family n=1 Tax=Clostridium sp. TaxID=1506 RepID=UPI0025BC8843|nr:phage holin, LLH family [Clostridium sp.]MCH3963022.1 phage holin, LLH family [Clostridium sp.]MCI1871399.1 phage holin, LLH family [Clostridium sp.]MCI2202948.1 phage holin, LLH family [Clostridium sp.]